jgi:hypothetical protein
VTTLEVVVTAMGVGRVLIGLAPFVAARRVSVLLGFPAEHDNPTARLMARLFGVRDVGLGVLAFYGIRHPEALGFLLLFNALTDFADLIAIGIPLARREGIDLGAVASAAFALPAGLCWLAAYALLR